MNTKLENESKRILGNAYLKNGYHSQGIKLLEDTKEGVLNTDYINASKGIINDLKIYIEDSDKRSIFEEGLSQALIFWKKGQGLIDVFAILIAPYFPGTAHTIMQKEINEQQKEVLLKHIVNSLTKILTTASKLKHLSTIEEINILCKKNSNLNKLLLSVADSYLKTGYIKKGLKIYTEEKRTVLNHVIEDIAEEYELGSNTSIECHIFLENIEKLKETLDTLIADSGDEDGENLKWKVAEAIANIENKIK